MQTQQNIIIRRSKVNPTLFLICNQEKVYRIFLDGVEKQNSINYNEISDHFNDIERMLKD